MINCPALFLAACRTIQKDYQSSFRLDLQKNSKAMNRITILLLLVFSVTVYCPAHSYEAQEVCATYLNSGKKYKVEGKIMMGSELNSRTHSFGYSSFSKYVAIFWAQNQVTLIELDSSFGPSAFGTKGKDQEGREWEISTSTMLCF